MRSEMLPIYREACSGMVKKALDLNLDSLKDSFSNLNPDAKAAIVAGLGGAGLGVATHMMTPKDKDEDTSLRLLKHVLAGAALGSLAGYGASRLNTRVGPIVNPPEGKPSIVEKMDPGYGTAALIAGGGTGLYAGSKALNLLRGSYGNMALGRDAPEAVTGIRNLLRATPEALRDGNEAVLRAANNAYMQARPTLKSWALQKLPDWFGNTRLGTAVRKAKNVQLERDADLLRKLVALGRGPRAAPLTGRGARAVTAAEQALLRKGLLNPRKIITAMRHGGRTGKTIAAALTAAGLIGTGITLKANGID